MEDNITLNSGENGVDENSYHVTLLVAYFLGFLGIHRFLNGKTGTGVAMLLTLGGCGIWSLVDVIMIMMGRFTNKEGQEIKINKPFFSIWSNVLVVCLFVGGLILNMIVRLGA